jgi:hypothetical protein
MRWFFHDAARCLAHADGTDAAVEHGAVGGGTAADAEALHDTLETLALRDAKHVDELALGENRDREDVAGLAGRTPR